MVVIDRVALVPQPPLLVPELVPGVLRETGAVREAAEEAVRWLRGEADRWLAVGPGDGESCGHYEPWRHGSFVGFGADVRVSLADPDDTAPGEVTADLPLPVLMTGWLRARAGVARAAVEVVDAGCAPEECARLGRRLGRRDERAGLLVLGDGSTRHGQRAPGGPDDRAAGFDETVAAALGEVDLEALGSLDAAEAAELGASGRATWQVAVGMARSRAVGDAEDDRKWRGEMLYSGAPFGVGYHVAIWERV
ncbi:hypothetical protein SAMN06265360_10965 [Haloechinothrix alba]|uniref:Catalytic LigB subunit of aromatic ring-opening dioxygenase n=1 Tax=Haloechinothrix alba TaxID=664784 RepID=A0A238X4M1_9PSEU|nr:hypothetical protein SAMN06265360_10965 [Haloechinothrix alba]